MLVAVLLLSGALSVSSTPQGPAVCACELGEAAFHTAPRPETGPVAVAGEIDSDGDGLSDADELLVGTDPGRVDTDCDAKTDGWEVGADAANALDADADGLADALEHPLADHDFDGITDEEDKGFDWQLLCGGIKPWAVKNDGSEAATIELRLVRYDDVVAVEVASTFDLTGLSVDGLALGPASTVTLYDDGTHGDELAGDGRFTRAGLTSGATGEMVAAFRFNRLHIVDAGGGQVIDLDSLFPTTGYQQLSIGVVDAQRVEPVTTIAPAVHASRHLVNLVDPLEAADVHRLMVMHAIGFLGTGTIPFYEHFPDIFDTIMLFPDVPSNIPFRGRWMPVRNDVFGLGLDPLDEGGFWGSTARLESVLLRRFDAFGPNLHEWTHRWANWLSQPELGLVTCGIGGHWGWNGICGILGGFDPADLVDQGGGLYTLPPFGSGGYATDTKPLADIELYLAGLLPADQVGPMMTFPSIDCASRDCANEDCSLWQFNGGMPQFTTIADVVAAVGPRIPDVSVSQKDFTMGGLIVSSVPLTSTEIAFYDYQLERFGGPGDGEWPFSFSELAQELATIHTGVAAYHVYRAGDASAVTSPVHLLGVTLTPGFEEVNSSPSVLTFYRLEEGSLGEADIRLSLVTGDAVRIDW